MTIYLADVAQMVEADSGLAGADTVVLNLTDRFFVGGGCEAFAFPNDPESTNISVCRQHAGEDVALVNNCGR